MMLGSTTVISGDLLKNTKQNGTKEIPPKSSGVIVNPIPKDRIGKQEIRIGGVSSTLREDQKPLCVVNGKISSWEEVETLDTKMIKTINILKDGTAIYGKKGKYGVVVITAKEKKFKKEKWK